MLWLVERFHSCFRCNVIVIEFLVVEFFKQRQFIYKTNFSTLKNVRNNFKHRYFFCKKIDQRFT